jgi:hypothetical protein
MSNMAYFSRLCSTVLFKAILFYIFCLFFHGYIYGEGDQIEFLSYTKYLLNPSLYPNDWYVQSIAHSLPNERLFLAFGLHFLGNQYLELGVFFLHALSGIALFAAWLRLEGNSPWSLYFLLLLFVPFYAFNLGGNDLYYGIFAGSCAAKALGSWALVYFLEKRINIAYCFLAIATFFQPIVGAQLCLIFTLILAFKFGNKASSIPLLRVLGSVFMFVSTAGVWLVLLFLKQQKQVLSTDSYLDINEFRASHHFFPAYFGLRNWLVLLPTFALGLVLYWVNFKKALIEENEKKSWENNVIILFYCITILGLCCYTLGVSYFRLSLFLSTQWFKTTIWLKALSVLVLFQALKQQLNRLKGISWLRSSHLLATCFLLCLCCLAPLHKMPQQFPFTAYKNAPFFDISLQAKQKTPANALFVQAADVTWFKYWSERSSYIDHKPIVQLQQYLGTWYDRIRALYQIDLNDRRAKKELITLANTHFFALREADFEVLKPKGVTHILTFKTHILAFPIVAENEVYRIYQLP